MLRYLDDHRIFGMLGSEGNSVFDSITLWDTSGEGLQTIAFQLGEGVVIPPSRVNSPARSSGHLAPFSRDHSRFVPSLVRMFIVLQDVIEIRVITSGRLCRLAERFSGLSHVPWEDWKGSTDVLDRLSSQYSWDTSVDGCRLFLDLWDLETSHRSIRMYDLTPSVYHQHKSSVDIDSAPHASILPSSYVPCWAKADRREISEDNIVLFEVSPPYS